MKIRLIQDKNSFCFVDSRGRLLEKPNEFINYQRTRGLSYHTIRAYAYDLKDFLTWLGPAKKISSLERAGLCQFIDQQRQRQYSPRSINRKIVTIELFYRFVTGKGVSAEISNSGYRAWNRDRTLGVQQIARPGKLRLRVKVPKKLITPLDTEQVCLLLGQFSRYRDLAICYLMLLCGLRAQEVLNIKKQDLRPFENKLLIHGKGNKERLVPFPPILCEVVSKYFSFEYPNCVNDSLFVVLQGKCRGQSMTMAGLRSLFRTRRHHQKLRDLHPHLLRHTFGSNMAANGLSLPVLQKLMGHAYPETTMQYVNLSMNDALSEFQQAIQNIAKSYQPL